MSSKALATGDPFSFAFRITPAGFGAFGLSRLAPIPHVPASYSGPDEIPLRSARLDCIKDQYKSESSSSLTFCNFSRSVCRFIRKMTRRPPLCPGAFRQGRIHEMEQMEQKRGGGRNGTMTTNYLRRHFGTVVSFSTVPLTFPGQLSTLNQPSA